MRIFGRGGRGPGEGRRRRRRRREKEEDEKERIFFSKNSALFKNQSRGPFFFSRFRSSAEDSMKNAPVSSGSPRAAAAAATHSLPRLAVPTPGSFEHGSAALLLLSPRRLTGAYSPRRSSLELQREATTTAGTTSASTRRSSMDCSAGSASSSFVDRRSRTTSESEVSVLDLAL